MPVSAIRNKVVVNYDNGSGVSRIEDISEIAYLEVMGIFRIIYTHKGTEYTIYLDSFISIETDDPEFMIMRMTR